MSVDLEKEKIILKFIKELILMIVLYVKIIISRYYYVNNNGSKIQCYKRLVLQNFLARLPFLRFRGPQKKSSWVIYHNLKLGKYCVYSAIHVQYFHNCGARDYFNRGPHLLYVRRLSTMMSLEYILFGWRNLYTIISHHVTFKTFKNMLRRHKNM